MIDRLRRRLDDAASIKNIMGGASSASVRALAYADGRRAVRLAFLSGAATNDILQHLPATSIELAETLAVLRPDRLDAWLRVGLELGELDRTGDTWIVAGRRSKAIVAGDTLVAPFYRSVAEYYLGSHVELTDLLTTSPGRTDLSDSAKTISDVSRVTEHLLAGAIGAVVDAVQPLTWLEIGCGSGVHLATALLKRDVLTAVAVDLDATVVTDTSERLEALGIRERADLRVGDALDVVDEAERFDVVTLLNNVYYFPEATRPALMERLSSMVRPGGELVVASQCAADPDGRGSIAAAQLDYLLRVQSEADASLPTVSGLRALVQNASGVEAVEVHRPVPGEPYVIVRGRVAGRVST